MEEEMMDPYNIKFFSKEQADRIRGTFGSTPCSLYYSWNGAVGTRIDSIGVDLIKLNEERFVVVSDRDNPACKDWSASVVNPSSKQKMFKSFDSAFDCLLDMDNKITATKYKSNLMAFVIQSKLDDLHVQYLVSKSETYGIVKIELFGPRATVICKGNVLELSYKGEMKTFIIDKERQAGDAISWLFDIYINECARSRYD